MSDCSIGVSNSFNDQCIFITGVTGFVGKVLLEKLLRCCPGIRQIFVLIRPKRTFSPKQRLEKLLQSEKSNPDFQNRITVINGDITRKNLGLSPEDVEMLSSQVSFIFHCAATVKFNEALRDAIHLNVATVKNLLDVCKNMKKLRALIHMSTAYSHCYLSHIKEKFYDIQGNPLDILSSINWLSEETMGKISNDVLGSFPNTYTYTRALAENLIKEYVETVIPDLPVSIVRPSIISPSWKEPFPAWCDSVNGPVGIIIAFGKGLMRTMIGDESAHTNFIPVDFSANIAIAAAWRLATQQKHSGITIYNASSCHITPFLWKDFVDCFIKNALDYPLEEPIRIPAYSNRLSSNNIVYEINWVFKHWIPAYILDFGMRVTGNRMIFLNAYDRMRKMADSLSYFSCRSWKWDTDNVKKLEQSMRPQDREIFYLNTEQVNWRQHIRDYHCGVKKYILKEDLAKVEDVKKSIEKRKTNSKLIKICFTLLIFYFLFNFGIF